MSIAEDLAIYARGIAEDIEHGASHILKVAAGSLYTALRKNLTADPIEVTAAAKEYALRLLTAHHRMAPILNFSNELLLLTGDSRQEGDVSVRLQEFALRVSNESSKAVDMVAAHSAEQIPGTSFMTHSRSSTLARFLAHIRDRQGLCVYVTYSRPGGEGRLLAGEMAVAGIRTVVIEEAEVMRYLDRVSALLLGADAIIPSGIVNKVGTHMISLAAREIGVPTYCLTESIKIWPFDEPILAGLAGGFSSALGSFEFFELSPGSAFSRIILETGPTTFEEISLDRREFGVAPEIAKMIGL